MRMRWFGPLRSRVANVSTVAAIVLAIMALAGCSAASTTPEPSLSSQPLDGLRPATVDVARIPFCDLVPQTAIAAALAGTPGSSRHWGNGDPAPVGGRGEISHEFGCSWTRSRTVASAWVFARPIDAAFARQVIASAGRAPGCTTVRSSTFGRPSMRQICTRSDRTIRIRRAGLFTDTWLTCELRGPRNQAVRLDARAETWCTDLGNALDTGLRTSTPSGSPTG